MANRPRWRSATRPTRRAPSRGRASSCSASTRWSLWTVACGQSPPTRPTPPPGGARSPAATVRPLSGRTDEVVSGFALVRDDAVTTGHELTRVTFRDLDEATLSAYLASGEWHDRAGAYAIQGRGAVLIARVDGDYLNVIGLPVAAIDALQRLLGSEGG